jgi:hypothetical protein
MHLHNVHGRIMVAWHACRAGTLPSAAAPAEHGRPSEQATLMASRTVPPYIDRPSRRTTHGSVTVSKIRWSLSWGVRPMWPPRGLTQASFGSPAFSSR